MLVRNEYGSCEFAFENDYVHIFNLFVKPVFRLQGKARNLLELAINEIKNTGHKDEILIVTDKKRLRDFYESLGLKVYSYYG